MYISVISVEGATKKWEEEKKKREKKACGNAKKENVKINKGEEIRTGCPRRMLNSTGSSSFFFFLRSLVPRLNSAIRSSASAGHTVQRTNGTLEHWTLDKYPRKAGTIRT